MSIEIGGLKILIEDDDELDEAVGRLRSIIDINKPRATKFLRCWSEARGSEIAGWNMCLLDDAMFYPDVTLEEIREKVRRALVREGLDGERLDEELEDRMIHCLEGSEGVIWIK